MGQNQFKIGDRVKVSTDEMMRRAGLADRYGYIESFMDSSNPHHPQPTFAEVKFNDFEATIELKYLTVAK